MFYNKNIYAKQDCVPPQGFCDDICFFIYIFIYINLIYFCFVIDNLLHIRQKIPHKKRGA